MDTPNMSSILRRHVSLAVNCIIRIYLNGHLPKLQTSGGLCYFLRDHLGYPIPSPALFRPMHDRFIHAVEVFAAEHDTPIVHFERGQRKDDLAADYRARFTVGEGVVFVGVAQERAISFKAHQAHGILGRFFTFSKQPVAVNHYYFYLQDLEWGPAFVKVGTYLPYPVRVCLNGHEWVKQQLRREGIGFESLDNGFLSCEQPERLQAICDALGPEDVQAFFDRWVERLPWPLTPDDRAAGYAHRLAIWQLEVSLTHVFDQPVQGRHFFEELIRENLDLGRPDRVSLLFPTRLTKATPAPPFGYRTRVITDGVNPSLHIEHKHSHVKQYFKEERALRTETTINDPGDFYTRKGVVHLPYLRTAGEQVNRKLLEVERITGSCVLTQDALDRLQRPTLEGGTRAPGLRFGDPRVMALFQGLCSFAHLPGRLPQPRPAPPDCRPARPRPNHLYIGTNELRPPSAAPQGPHLSRAWYHPLHRHDLWPPCRALCLQGLPAHLAARMGRPHPGPGRSAPASARRSPPRRYGNHPTLRPSKPTTGGLNLIQSSRDCP